MKAYKKTTRIMFILATVSLLATLFIYSALPAHVPTHFGVDGRIDSYGAKSTLLMLGVLPLAILVLMVYLPKFDPLRKNYVQFSKTYETIKVIIVALFIVIHWLLVAVAMGWIKSPQRTLVTILSIFFIAMGNYLPKIKHNYFVGIKTPWTIANETSWERTHRLSGYLFAGLGIIVFILSFVHIVTAFTVLIFGTLAIAVVATVYSYNIFKKAH